MYNYGKKHYGLFVQAMPTNMDPRYHYSVCCYNNSFRTWLYEVTRYIIL